MRYPYALIVLICSITINPIHASTGTYIIVDAISEFSHEEQPTWIAIYSKKRGKTLHLPTGKFLHKTRQTQGVILLHVDYSEGSSAFCDNTQYLTKGQDYELKIIRGKINYVGLIVVSPEGENRHSIQWSEELLKDACRANPEVFNTHAVVGKGQELFIDCSSLISE